MQQTIKSSTPLPFMLCLSKRTLQKKTNASYFQIPSAIAMTAILIYQLLFLFHVIELHIPSNPSSLSPKPNLQTD